MIRINLLPFRAARKKENVRRQISVFLLSVILLGLIVFLFNRHLDNQIAKWDSKVKTAEAELADLRDTIKEINQVKAFIATLNKKIEVIENLEQNRTESAYMLSMLSDVVKEASPHTKGASAATATIASTGGKASKKSDRRLWFNRLSFDNHRVAIQGVALDNQTVADFMTRLEKVNRLKPADRSAEESDEQWAQRLQTGRVFSSVTLINTQQQTFKDNVKLKSFSISCTKAAQVKKVNETKGS